MEGILDNAVFSAGGRTYAWRDVVQAAQARGDWVGVERAARLGMAAERLAAREGDPLTRETQAAADAFRYEHNLLAAEEMEAWLAAWDLDLGEWFAWVRRSLLRERLPVEAEDAPAAPSEAEWTEAVCSGALDRLALALARRVAAHEAVAGEAPDAGATAEMQASYERLRDEALGGDAIEREVAAHRLEWTRLDCRCLTVTDADMAREAVFCVRDEGMDLAAVAASAGLEVVERRWYLDGSPQPFGEALLGARAGDLVGPSPVEGGLVVCVVAERAEPSAADPSLRERAERHVVSRAFAREVAARVRWHVRPPGGG